MSRISTELISARNPNPSNKLKPYKRYFWVDHFLQIRIREYFFVNLRKDKAQK